MPKEKITVQMDAEKATHLRVLAACVSMHVEEYCAMVLSNHIQRKADIDAKGEHA